MADLTLDERIARLYYEILSSVDYHKRATAAQDLRKLEALITQKAQVEAQ